ncbi:MAG TPA: protein-methionine-sulfoxide reductase heme-binding subunit MsrQ [Pyrinomonadaceae bacterium]|jgi:sulfoxide reductase heme-binding subunit YedZ|nr:protein-methionine-sulfoxide reductase heme-binding subunit MsrQ [Pyrinomonadaceae bacterium]
MFAPDIKFTRFVVFLNGLVPAVLLAWDAYQRKLGANPIEFATRATGVLALVFLFVTLAVTPLRKLTGANWVVKLRRQVGLYAFFYACLHLLTYVWFDKFFGAREIVEDVWARPFITIGMASFLLLVPLAATSTGGMIKRLGGKRWAKLHKLTYVAAVGGVIHFYMGVKADTTTPILFAVVLALLLGYRWLRSRMDATPKSETLGIQTPPR